MMNLADGHQKVIQWRTHGVQSTRDDMQWGRNILDGAYGLLSLCHRTRPYNKTHAQQESAIPMPVRRFESMQECSTDVQMRKIVLE